MGSDRNKQKILREESVVVKKQKRWIRFPPVKGLVTLIAHLFKFRLVGTVQKRGRSSLPLLLGEDVVGRRAYE
jgi:hypothetical protein